ncbi:hypothetical protein [Parafrankia sp. EUN1f]|uniref:hypothetical protein n=1 Tax=Parafrankia sp. EUN1f TaxID=102897 RepID=UPI0001C4557C|nr:hypothetical protein [Parafrankia sp. EUN1f]EFC86467.1 hypothetical protein FrEUN1fDRAFT_0362 [Parafrankia sp. EUN1f]
MPDLGSFRRRVRQAGAELKGELKAANIEVSEIIVEGAKAKASGQGKQANRAASTLKAGKSASDAYVNFGTKRKPYALGSEFGSKRDHPRELESGRTMRGWNQFRSWRGNKEGAGYFLWPTIRQEKTKITETYLAAIDRIVGIMARED